MLSSDWVSTASAFFAGISALVAAAAIYFPWRVQNSQEILHQSILSLERAFAALSNNGQEVGPPAPDRLNWLTAARHIEQYRRLKTKLTLKTHRIVCEEHEEHWRHQFYTCLDAPTALTTAYYSEKQLPDRRAQIEPKSAIIVHNFAKWPEGRDDPIDKANVAAILARGEVLKGNYGLRDYLESLPKYGTKA